VDNEAWVTDDGAAPAFASHSAAKVGADRLAGPTTSALRESKTNDASGIDSLQKRKK